MRPALAPTQDAYDAVVLLQRLTSFMALRDPGLVAAAAAAAAVGADELIPLFQEELPGEGYDACKPRIQDQAQPLK
jgi:hypothetical protein